MPLELITGLPGNAKTLYSIQLLIERAKREGRAVYYSGLKDFQKDDPRLQGTEWFEFDPLKWHETVPAGALVFIDEAQKVFRARSLGTLPGPHVTELEEHRHKGLDFVLITQHPSLIDPAIRKLTQTHRHMMRIWGMEASTVHVWGDGVKDAPDKAGTRTSSEKTKWAFAKDLYGLYKSAEVHTVKRSIPGRVKLLAVLLLLLAGLIWYAVHLVGKKTQRVDAANAASAQGAPGNPIQLGNARQVQAPPDPIEDAKVFVWKETPRVTGLPQTAPKYDELTKPSKVPVPAMCVQIGSANAGSNLRCKCYTQQATPMQVDLTMCLQIAQHGFFEDFEREGRKAEASQQVLARTPDAPLPDRREVGPSVIVIPEVPDRPAQQVRASGSPAKA